MAAKKRVLFVDDEPGILDAMRLMMRRERDRWDMVFADGAERALLEVERAPFDIVVSDMRMPGMDGAELLAQIRSRAPATMRVMITGYADSDAIARALPSIHQLFAKPCAPKVLRATLERCHQIEAHVRAAVGGIDQLPSPPRVYQQLQEVISRGTARASEVCAIIAGDPAFAARVLQLANSSFFGDGSAVCSIERAVASLGIERMQYLVLGASLGPTEPGDPAELLRRVRALIADPAQAELACAAALLRDVGRDIAEPHAEIGAALLAIWGLPDAIVDIVRFHHAPDAAPEAARPLIEAILAAEAAS